MRAEGYLIRSGEFMQDRNQPTFEMKSIEEKKQELKERLKGYASASFASMKPCLRLAQCR